MGYHQSCSSSRYGYSGRTLLMSSSAALVVVLCCFLVTPGGSNTERVNQPSKQHKLLMLPYDNTGSHFTIFSQLGTVLARQGHQVTFLLVDSERRHLHKSEAAWSSTVVYKSRFTDKDKADAFGNLTRQALRGERRGTFFLFNLIYDSILFGAPALIDIDLAMCDDLLGDTVTLQTLISENFEMLIGDARMMCVPILAQMLDIPFVIVSCTPTLSAVDALQYGVPADPSYIPEWSTRFTNKMTFVQRVQNVLSYAVMEYLHSSTIKTYQQLKVKYNIRPEISMLQAFHQVKFIVVNVNFPLEYPRPVYPNAIFSTPLIGLVDNKTVDEDVAVFLDTALAGFVIFSLGGYVTKLERQTTQMIADAFASVPYKVLWQTNGDTFRITFGSNTKVVNWVPLAQIMNHKNAKVFVSHCGVNSVLEATWAGLPIVGIPLFADQFGNIDKVVARGFGVSLELADLTINLLTETIKTVAEEPQFRERALHASRIFRNLVSLSPPAETLSSWIAHVAELGSDHLRPAVLDVQLQQDVYLICIYLVSLLTTTVLFFHLLRKMLQGQTK